MPGPAAPWASGTDYGFLLTNPDMAQVPAADVVDRQLRSMTPEEKTAATIVAMAGPLSLSQILRISGPKAVDALDTAGIIAVSTGHDRLVRAASPILGEIIRQRVPAGRSSALRSSVLSLPSARAAAPGAALNRLRWSMDCGVEIPPIQLLQAAVAANTDLDPATAGRVAGAIRDARFLPEARIQLAYSHFIAGHTEAAVACLESAQPVPSGRPSYLAALLAARLGSATPARQQHPDAGTHPPAFELPIETGLLESRARDSLSADFATCTDLSGRAPAGQPSDVTAAGGWPQSF